MFTNHYSCPCGCNWQSDDDCMCNDRCPTCNTEIEPHESHDANESDVFDTQEEYTIASHWLSYLINGDNSGYTDEEDEMIQKWEKEVHNGRAGHFSYPDDDIGDNFAMCEVSGMLADCTTVTFWPNKN